MWSWLIIAVVIAFVCGQILNMIPSRQDRAREQLRKAAMDLGLKVVFTNPEKEGWPHYRLPPSGFSYMLRWNMPGDGVCSRIPSPWVIVATASGIDWSRGNYPAFIEQEALCLRGQLGNEILVCGANESGLFVFWIEHGTPTNSALIFNFLQLIKDNLLSIN